MAKQKDDLIVRSITLNAVFRILSQAKRAVIVRMVPQKTFSFVFIYEDIEPRSQIKNKITYELNSCSIIDVAGEQFREIFNSNT
jgi:hypothetical protein